jgi:hypothetical protein
LKRTVGPLRDLRSNPDRSLREGRVKTGGIGRSRASGRGRWPLGDTDLKGMLS